ncbi:MAG: hypothetical protein WCT99_05190 [Bacteroidota bacterium]|jgi:hypothetical protein
MSISINTLTPLPLPSADTAYRPVIKSGESRFEEITKASFTAVANGVPSEAGNDVVTKDEKQFFASLFPENSAAIKSYSVYASTGMKKNINLGSIIDMKG